MFSIRPANYSSALDSAAITGLLNEYASSLSGGGAPLSDAVRANLVGELQRRPAIHTFLAFEDDTPAGLLISHEGFSTFACRPLLNIHDLIVSAPYRGRGLGRQLLAAAEICARDLGCCKLTLEVLEGNETARRLYATAGFHSYELDPAMGHALFLDKKL